MSLSTSLSLLERLRKPDDTAAWPRFVRLYTPLLLVWLQRLGFQDSDSEDLIQEVLVDLIRGLPTYERRGDGSFRGWLHKITRNQCVNFRRRQARQVKFVDSDLPTIEDQSPIAELDETEYRLQLAKQAMQLVQSDFNAATWAAFTGLMLENRPVSDVARGLNVTENAVNLARYRVLKRLREELDGFLD
jgi:RNA polymerase sigma-70 factor, ECF subfamily